MRAAPTALGLRLSGGDTREESYFGEVPLPEMSGLLLHIPTGSGGDRMLVHAPTDAALAALLGKDLFDVWRGLCALVERKYDMERAWSAGGKSWTYEYKYRRGGKTLCALYAREGCLGFLVILGKAERAAFEADTERYPAEVRRIYDETKTYHDGKWLMLMPQDTSLFPHIEKLLEIKRKPNKK